jgi:hypothetical protein
MSWAAPRHQPTPDCPNCAKAREGVGCFFSPRCTGCVERSAARSQAHFDARKAGRITGPYRTLLDALGVSHEAVKAAWAADVEARQRDRERADEIRRRDAGWTL